MKTKFSPIVLLLIVCCIKAYSQNLTINYIVAINASSCNACNGSATATVSGGVTPYTYYWSNGETANPDTDVCPGFYTLRVHDFAGDSTERFFFIGPPTITLNLGFTNGGCANNNGTATVNARGGASPYTYSWSPGNGSTATVSGLSAGSYTVTVTDTNGCTATGSVAITSGLTLFARGTNTTCNGNSTGTAGVVYIGGGTSPYTYSWAPSGGSAATASGLSAGTYTVTVTDSTGCSATTTAVVNQPPPLGFNNAAVTGASCNSNTGTAYIPVTGGSGGYNYTWSPSGGNNAFATGLSAGTYTLTVTDRNGCTATSSISVPVTGPVPAYFVINALCNGASSGSATIYRVTGGNSPYTYSWAPSGGSAATASGLSAGTYTVTVTDSTGCSGTTSVVVNQPPPLGFNNPIITGASCNGNTGTAFIPVTGGSGGYNYEWSPSGGNFAFAAGLSAGTYTLTVTDRNGCTATSSVNIPVTGPVPAIFVTNDSCNGASNGSATIFRINGGSSPYTYSWAPSGVSAAIATGLSAGTYTVTITDTTGCSGTTSVVINQPQPIGFNSATVTGASCNSNTGSAYIPVTGGTGPYNYVWSPSGGNFAFASGLSAGTYTLTVTDRNGCTATSSVNIPVTGPVPAISATNDSCNGGSNGSATITRITGGSSPYTYSWAPSGGSVATASGLSAGTYTVTVTDNTGCSATLSVAIIQPLPLGFNSATITGASCNGNTGSATIPVTGGTGPYNYMWSPSGGSNAIATGLSAGSYTLTVTDHNGCTASSSVSITASGLVPAFSVTNVSCNGESNGSATITSVTGGSSPYTYSWAPSGGTAASATGLSAGTYTVTLSDSTGCQVTAPVRIAQPSTLGVSASINAYVTCFGGSNGSATSTGNGGTTPFTYSWSNGSSGAFVTGLSGGGYTVTANDANGCTVTAFIYITQPAALSIKADSTNDNGSCNGSAWVIVNGGVNPYTYLWNPGNETSDSIYAQCYGSYCCTVTDYNGCMDSACVTVSLLTGINQLSMVSGQCPVFPNPGNGKFTISITNYELGIINAVEVYNVLGEKVYSQFNIHNSTFNIDLSAEPNGIYFYRVLNEDACLSNRQGGLIGDGKLVIEK